MGRRLLYCLLIAVVCLSSCKKGEKVIPRNKMAKIYAEMFTIDQEIASQSGVARVMADTSYVYEPIFEKYGYTSDDFRASMEYYIEDANRYARILRNTAAILEDEIKDLKKKKAEMELLSDANIYLTKFAPSRIYYMTGMKNPRVVVDEDLVFYIDSTGGQFNFDPRDWEDVAYYGPEIVSGARARRVSDPIIKRDNEAKPKTNSELKDAGSENSSGNTDSGKKEKPVKGRRKNKSLDEETESETVPSTDVAEPVISASQPTEATGIEEIMSAVPVPDDGR